MRSSLINVIVVVSCFLIMVMIIDNDAIGNYSDVVSDDNGAISNDDDAFDFNYDAISDDNGAVVGDNNFISDSCVIMMSDDDNRLVIIMMLTVMIILRFNFELTVT